MLNGLILGLTKTNVEVSSKKVLDSTVSNNSLSFQFLAKEKTIHVYCLKFLHVTAREEPLSQNSKPTLQIFKLVRFLFPNYIYF